jgi:protein MPE1
MPAMGAGRGYRMEMMEPVRPPPPGYTCFRCGEKGHYINMCPTIGDKNFDNKPKIKKATGIPTMFLKTIQNKDKDNVDRGLMVTHEGDLVVAMPNEYGFLM